jgi:hypothetical protein
MQFKTTTKLFQNKYQYKVVLVCSGAQHFRSGDFADILDRLKKIDLDLNKARSTSRVNIKTVEELEYAVKLAQILDKFTDIDIRVESPWISIYTNNRKDLDAVIKLDKEKIKYISEPPKNSNLNSDSIIMPKMNYDYRVTLGKTTQEHTAFLEWAENSTKCKLTKSCIRDLTKSRSWGGTHFYISGDNNLLFAKVHLGGSISKIERIVKN